MRLNSIYRLNNLGPLYLQQCFKYIFHTTQFVQKLKKNICIRIILNHLVIGNFQFWRTGNLKSESNFKKEWFVNRRTSKMLKIHKNVLYLAFFKTTFRSWLNNKNMTLFPSRFLFSQPFVESRNMLKFPPNSREGKRA